MQIEFSIANLNLHTLLWSSGNTSRRQTLLYDTYRCSTSTMHPADTDRLSWLRIGLNAASSPHHFLCCLIFTYFIGKPGFLSLQLYSYIATHTWNWVGRHEIQPGNNLFMGSCWITGTDPAQDDVFVNRGIATPFWMFDWSTCYIILLLTSAEYM
jgi:hypothetical protein